MKTTGGISLKMWNMFWPQNICRKHPMKKKKQKNQKQKQTNKQKQKQKQTKSKEKQKTLLNGATILKLL